MRNIALLEEAMRKVIEHPELHNQDWFFIASDCGTTGCFAGWACWLAGYQTSWTAAEFPTNGINGRMISSRVVARPGGPEYDAWTMARRLLGLTSAEAMVLFAPCNTIEMLQIMVKELVSGDQLHDLPYYMDDYTPAGLVDLP